MSVANKIEANDKSLRDLLQARKYSIDFFQREYKWQRKHIEQLLIDLEESFLDSYSLGDTVIDVVNYNSYYIGPVIFFEKGGSMSIIDGQQRLTSITLILFHINQLQKDRIDQEPIKELIYSRKHGKDSFNLNVPERLEIFESFYKGEEFDISETINLSILNLYDRYADIKELFPQNLKNEKLPLFIDWLKEKLTFVEIIAYSDKNAYSIFETMNDRGYNITPSEMLKGLLLSRVEKDELLFELNDIWRSQISNLHYFSIDEDLEFFRAWLRVQFAETMKTSTAAGTAREDFEKIGTSFHRWVKENSKKLKLSSEESYFYFVKGDFVFYSDLYLRIKKYEKKPIEGFEIINHLTNYSIATSLAYPLYMASISKSDSEEIIKEKLRITSKFIEKYIILKSVNLQPISQTSIRYSFFNSVIKKIRNLSSIELEDFFNQYISSLNLSFDNLNKVSVANSNTKFIRYLLAKVTIHLGELVDQEIDFYDLIYARRKSGCKMIGLIGQTHRSEFKKEDQYISAILSVGSRILKRKDSNSVKEQNILTRIYSINNVSNSEKTILESKFNLPKGTQKNVEYVNERIDFLKDVCKEIW